MPVDSALTSKIWNRYIYCRDNGHEAFVQKATLCDQFFIGQQWTAEDRAALKLARRPALTINKIISTMANVMGEQIFQRSEIAFRPRSGSPAETAEALTKVFKQISDNNQLDWKRSDMFADGIITSRGFLDARIGFTDSMQGEVEITHPSPKNVIIDPDADEYDPDTWRDVFITKWVTADDIAVLYGQDEADILRMRGDAITPYGYDSMQFTRDRFGPPTSPGYTGGAGFDHSEVTRNIRLIERQYKKLDRQKHFVEVATGDMRPIPADFDRNRIAWFVEKFGFQVTTKLVSRIRWTAIADNVRLHDDWSPYKRFTIIPYFPFFRRGHTVGLVENLLGSQELLNKTSSQELHIVNTTANSGWKVKTGALTNMSPEELEQRGAETGLVIEFNDNPDDIEKIQPNSVPTGLDRISYKAEEHIKSISGVSDSQQGFDREDVAAKAIQTKRQASATNMAKPLDSLVRSDWMLARHLIDLVQGYYTEERLLTITKDKMTGETEQININQATPEGNIVNDLTLGEYDVVISSVPQRETLEDSQFEQALSLREAGVMIPDAVLIENSRLMNKGEIVKQMAGDQDSPEAQAQRALALRGQEAEVSKIEGEAKAKHADAGLKQAKAQKELVAAHKEANTPIEDQGDGGAALMKAEADINLDDRRFAHEVHMADKEFGLEVQKLQMDQQLKVKAQQDDADTARMAAATAAAQPQPKANQGVRA